MAVVLRLFDGVQVRALYEAAINRSRSRREVELAVHAAGAASCIRYSCIARAAILASRRAVTTRSAPFTSSPPAKTPGRFVCPVARSMTMRPHVSSHVLRRGGHRFVGVVADGEHDGVRLERELRSLHGLRAAAAALVRRAQLHAHELGRAHASRRRPEEPHRRARNSKRTPSSRACCRSSSRPTISFSVRRYTSVTSARQGGSRCASSPSTCRRHR